MKTVTENVCGFDEVFDYAGKNFGIDWNACNHLFFDEVLQYGDRTEICTSECVASKDVDHTAPEEGDPRKWNRDIRRSVAEKVLYHFLVSSGVNRCVVDCRD